MWFDSWSDLLRILLVGTAAYVTLIVLLRLSGKRTLSQLNMFDFVVTVALGSTLATALLSSDVSWAEGAVAFALISALQFAIAWTSAHWPATRRAVTASPALLMVNGVMLDEELRRSRLTASEVRQAIRSSGFGGTDRVAAVVLEPNGTFSVIGADKVGDGSALSDVTSAHGERPRGN
ncbi:DUF421 domain-containing protein [Microbacterium sp. A1-JK]|uniref:DUF421 domain-containing protein n=1 Tax=Microbacterium sp. A1-JK TaxID=3177516 RepID=UPI00388519FF